MVYINGSFGPKINRVFTELFFIMEGTVEITLEDYEKHILEKEDMFIVQPDTKHTIFANNAKIFTVCNPPFNQDLVEYCS